MQEARVRFLGQKDAHFLEGNGNPFQYSWGLSSLVTQRIKCLPAMRETQVQCLGQEDPMEKEMATHSSILGGFPGDSEVKASASNAGDTGSIPGSGRSPGERNGNPLQYSCLEKPMEGGAW